MGVPTMWSVAMCLVSLLGMASDVSGTAYCTGCTGDGCDGNGMCERIYGCSAKTCVVKCDDMRDCHGGQADYVSDASTCICKSCGPGYEGIKCDTCTEGYEKVGQLCELVCTPAKACGGDNRASAAEYVTASKSCKCTCINKWEGLTCNNCPSPYTGSRCDQCETGTINFPGCKACTNADHCNMHAESVTSSSQTQCKCTCKSEFAGLECGECAAGRTNYPQCAVCSVTEACSGNANKATVSGDKKTCTCSCTGAWEGQACNSCPSMYEQSTCAQCAGEAIGFPTCTACSSKTHCNGHAATVVAAANKKSCTCTCADNWEGNTCKSCPTKYEQSTCKKCAANYIGYPSCEKCDLTKHCSGHATEATSTNGKSCTCKCANKWSESDCSKCVAPYAGSNCNQCAGGYENYPTCTAICSKSKNCNNHASAVKWVSGTTCECTCSDKWEGNTCKSCPTKYEQSTCKKCAANYIGYPSCEKCDLTKHCSGHATEATSANGKSCTCKCANKWSESDCSKCVAPYAGSNCNQCAGGYENYPTCTAICSKSKSCNNHASAVKWVSGTTCECTCSDKWEGNTCKSCPTKYEQSTCKKCAANYIGYPSCEKCDLTKHCSGHATEATSTNGKSCTCKCTNNWSGGDCSKCVAPYAGSNCNQCAGGYENYPTCTAICSKSKNCNNHASAVKWVSGTTCECTCSDKWEGNTCKSCPTKYEQSTCKKCAANYIGYPSCEKCDLTKHCSGHATEATSANGKSCTCKCANNWSGGDCSKCVAPYAGSNCNQCAGGYENYPTCTAICSKSKNCNNHASAVKWVSGTTCECTCSDKWEGNTCKSCPTMYEQSTCKKCAANYIGYPSCEKCDLTKHCTAGRATGVAADTNQRNCVCACSNQWGGNSCDVCSSPFAGANCDQCEGGLKGYPNCVSKCMLDASCSGATHATKVIWDSTTDKCACTCRNKWSGDMCEKCLSPFGGAECNSCTAGFIKFPGCEACDLKTHCSGNAQTVTSEAPFDVCKCQCINQFSGTDCSVCSSPYTGAQCDQCEGGLKGYPNCQAVCGVDTHCTGHAGAVKWLQGDGTQPSDCECTCSDQWNGTACNTCQMVYDQTTCAACAEGHVQYPTCTPCTPQDCNSHAESVGTNAGQTECVCTCRHQWGGGDCAVCDTSKYGGSDCNECAVGLINYPDCTAACTVASNCSDHAVSSEFIPQNTSCLCTCTGMWTGTACDTCPMQYEQTTCASCATGYKNYPACGPTCTVDGDCSPNAESVEFANPGCTCKCRNAWAGGDCRTCPMGYEESKGCAVCAAGYAGYPNCQLCTVQDSCSGHASSVTADVETNKCICGCTGHWVGEMCDACYPGFAGDNCTLCAPGHVPGDGGSGCEECSVDGHCSGHAESVSTEGNTCTCKCINQWVGERCDVCPALYTGVNCNRCRSEGNCPACNTPCEVQHDCHGNGVSVEGDLFEGPCRCTCRNKFSSFDGCITCPIPFAGENCDGCHERSVGVYPNCMACDSEYCNYNGVATVVLVDNMRTCQCKCKASTFWTGARCDTCDKATHGESCTSCPAGGTPPDCIPPTPQPVPDGTATSKPGTGNTPPPTATPGGTGGAGTTPSPGANGAALGEGDDRGSGSDFPWWVVAVVVALLLLSSCAAAAFFLMRRRAEPQGDAYTDFDSKPREMAGASQSSYDGYEAPTRMTPDALNSSGGPLADPLAPDVMSL